MAEYALADLGQVIPKPNHLSHLDAASVPLTALTAWQVLYDQARLKKGPEDPHYRGCRSDWSLCSSDRKDDRGACHRISVFGAQFPAAE